MNTPTLEETRAYVEHVSSERHTKVICVEWTVREPGKLDGEWSVEWIDMFADLSEDARSARSEQGGYFALQREGGRSESGVHVEDTDVRQPGGQSQSNGNGNPDFNLEESTPTLKSSQLYPDGNSADPPYTAPISTAKLLEFENGPAFQELQEDLPAFFAFRPIVQAPTNIAVGSSSRKAEVYFLLSPSTAIPSSVRVSFTPTWTPPNTPPAVLAEIRVSSSAPRDNLHAAWSKARLADLNALQEVARELEQEGSRGTGQGRVKVGVEGGGMDEEAVRREGWMVGEEMIWVRDHFLSTPVSETTTDGLNGLGISSSLGGLSLNTGSSVELPAHVDEHEEEEEDLFALPLSPRSPDMSVSPFSMFRGDAISTPQPSKLRQVVNVDTAAEVKSNTPIGDDTPTNADSTPTGPARRGTGNAPPTPPSEN